MRQGSVGAGERVGAWCRSPEKEEMVLEAPLHGRGNIQEALSLGPSLWLLLSQPTDLLQASGPEARASAWKLSEVENRGTAVSQAGIPRDPMSCHSFPHTTQPGPRKTSRRAMPYAPAPVCRVERGCPESPHFHLSPLSLYLCVSWSESAEASGENRLAYFPYERLTGLYTYSILYSFICPTHPPIHPFFL